MLKILLPLLCTYVLADNIYFLPANKNQVLNKLITSVSNAKQNINIAMYNFTHKKIAKELKKIANKGISINIILDSKALSQKSKLQYLSKLKNTNTYTLTGAKRTNNKHYKMHSKYITIDNKIAIFGSINYTKSSFNGNYEVVYFSQDKDIVQKFNKNFEHMKKIAKKYN